MQALDGHLRPGKEGAIAEVLLDPHENVMVQVDACSKALENCEFPLLAELLALC